MNDIIIFLMFLSPLLVVLFVLTLPYLIWMLYTAFKRRWKKLAIQIAVPLLVLALLLVVAAIRNRDSHRQYMEGVFGGPVNLPPALFEYDTARAFNGDGYSISVYELPDELRKRFEAADQALLTHFPKLPGFRQGWHSEPWRKAPLDKRLERHLDFALSTYNAAQTAEAKQRDAFFEEIRRLLAGSDAYYALFFNTLGGYIGDIDFFIVDPASGKLYIINHNT